MKVLFLTPGIFDKGGISRYNRFQIRALRDRYGQEHIRVLSKLGPDGDGFEEDIQVSWSGRPNHPLARTRLTTRIAFLIQALRYAIQDRPDIVLTGHVNLGPPGWIVAAAVQGLLVQNIYGTEVWTGLSGMRRRALTSADAVISDCHNTADFAEKTGLRKETPDVVWDCVDTKRYTPGVPNETVLDHYGIGKEGHFRLMFLGRLMSDARYKGTERLLQLLAKLPDNFECVLAGGGDDVGHLHELADRLGLGKRAYFPGRIDEDHMPDVYRSADAFYLVSEFGYDKGEGLPLTPIEAMACGVPVIVGDQDGSREILDGSGGGICISPGIEEPAVNYIRKLKSDSAYFVAERKAARQRVEIAFSYEHFAQKTIAVLEELLAR
jgi:phosphatidylinositol alpha-1,6-mannosyltransferase